MALHCPATLHVVGADSLDGALAGLADQHVAVVCVGEDPELRPAAESSAATLGVPVRVVAGLGDGSPRHHALVALADEFRGEHLLVLVPGHHRLVTMEIGDDGIRHLD